MNIQIDKTTIDEITRQLAVGNTHNIRAGYLLGKVEGENVIVDGVYVPQQNSNKGETLILQEERLKAFKAIEASGKKIMGCVLYNGPYAAFENETTRKSREKLSETVGYPNIGLVVNAMGDHNIFE
jgi:hypothetical protein